VENFVDNLPVRARATSAALPSALGAQKNGMKIFFPINELHRRDAPQSRTTVGSANIGAAVELSRRAGRCFVDG
jgi:hypothetical protein